MNRVLFVLIVIIFQSISASSTTYFYSNTSKVNFSSDAPQELISASSNSMRGLIDADKKTFIFKVLIRTFSGFNSALQKEHFNEKFLESEKYPEALFSGKIIEDIDFTIPGTYTIRTKGKFIIHGVEQERIVKTEITIKGEEIIFSTKFTILLADFNIKVPKVVHEKIASEISVEVEGVLKKKILQE